MIGRKETLIGFLRLWVNALETGEHFRGSLRCAHESSDGDLQALATMFAWSDDKEDGQVDFDVVTRRNGYGEGEAT